MDINNCNIKKFCSNITDHILSGRRKDDSLRVRRVGILGRP